MSKPFKEEACALVDPREEEEGAAMAMLVVMGMVLSEREGRVYGKREHELVWSCCRSHSMSQRLTLAHSSSDDTKYPVPSGYRVRMLYVDKRIHLNVREQRGEIERESALA